MSRYLWPSLACILILGGCASQPETVPEQTEQVSLQEESQLLTQSRTLISRAAPDSFSRAIEDLATSDVGSSELGIELTYVASRMLNILYPLRSAPEVDVVTPSAASIYISMFENIEAGRYVAVAGEEASFLTLVVPPLAILFSDSEETATQAEGALEQAASLNPDSVIPELLLGIIDERRGEIDQALAHYQAAVNVSSICYPALTGRARMEIARNNPDAAIPILEVLLATLPETTEHLALLARATFLSGDSQAASSIVQDAIILAQTDGQDDPRLLLLRAQILESLGSDDAASRLIQIIEPRLPENREVLGLKAKILRKRGDRTAAVEVYEEVLALYPEDPDLRDDFGELLINIGELDRGREIVVATLEANPGRARSLTILLDVAISTKDWFAAAVYAELLVLVDDSTANLRKAVLAYTGAEEYDLAADLAQTLYELESEDPDALIMYTRALIRAGRGEDSLELLLATVDDVPEGAKKSDVLLMMSGLVDDQAKRLEYLLGSLGQNVENVPALVATSEYYEEIEDYKRAYRWLKLAAALEKENDEFRSRLEDIARKGDL